MQRLAVWAVVWLASLALASFGPPLLWDGHRGASWAAVAINVAVGVGLIASYAGYLRTVDELQRKIQQDALAVTLGAGCVLGFGYVVAELAGLLSPGAGIGSFTVLLVAVYGAAIAVGHFRYR